MYILKFLERIYFEIHYEIIIYVYMLMGYYMLLDIVAYYVIRYE